MKSIGQRILFAASFALIIIGGVAIFTWALSNEEPSEANVSIIDEVATDPNISYTDDGFVPAQTSVELGTTVVITNSSNRSMWVASDDHPTHKLLPEFDAMEGVGPGETFEFQFDEVGEWGYHNHLKSDHTATITVTEPVKTEEAN